MAQAAAQLGVSQPAVSSVIADLERTLGVPLFERSTRGVKPTMYARAMMDRSVAAFDELKQGIRTIENLADPTAGELWIGCIDSVAALVLPPLLEQFMRQYPRVVVQVLRLSSPIPQLPRPVGGDPRRGLGPNGAGWRERRRTGLGAALRWRPRHCGGCAQP